MHPAPIRPRPLSPPRHTPRDRVTAQGVADALRGLPWVLREHDPVPAHLERGYRLLEDMQLNSRARNYVF